MAEKKITKKEKFEMVKALIADHADLVEFIDHEIDLLSRKASKSATATPAQKDAIAIAEIIKDILAECEDSKGMTVGAILKDERIKSYVRYNGDTVSSQVVTSIFSKGAVSEANPNGDFVRTVEKKTAYYALNYGVEG